MHVVFLFMEQRLAQSLLVFDSVWLHCQTVKTSRAVKWQMSHTALGAGVVSHSQSASSQPMTLVCNNGGEEVVRLCKTTWGVGVRGRPRGQHCMHVLYSVAGGETSILN